MKKVRVVLLSGRRDQWFLQPNADKCWRLATCSLFGGCMGGRWQPVTVILQFIRVSCIGRYWFFLCAKAAPLFAVPYSRFCCRCRCRPQTRCRLVLCRSLHGLCQSVCVCVSVPLLDDLLSTMSGGALNSTHPFFLVLRERAVWKGGEKLPKAGRVWPSIRVTCRLFLSSAGQSMGAVQTAEWARWATVNPKFWLGGRHCIWPIQ